MNTGTEDSRQKESENIKSGDRVVENRL
jgi:hypothetical protein